MLRQYVICRRLESVRWSVDAPVIAEHDSKGKKKKENNKHAATTPHNIVYRTITTVNKLITVVYKNFIASHVGHIEFLITSCP